MDVILLERIARLGGLGDTVRVRDGYARNYLLPTGRALRANEANQAKFEAQKAQLVARNEERKGEASQIGETLDGKTFVIVRSAGETGQLYGSVSARDISDLLKAEGYSVSRNAVELNQPIKAIGLHKVTIALHAEVSIEITANVARSQDEAERQAQGETLTSADAIYGYDEDALRAEDLGGAMFDEDEGDEPRREEPAQTGVEE
jgi:large subunit ribosomal protein L9